MIVLQYLYHTMCYLLLKVTMDVWPYKQLSSGTCKVDIVNNEDFTRCTVSRALWINTFTSNNGVLLFPLKDDDNLNYDGKLSTLMLYIESQN